MMNMNPLQLMQQFNTFRQNWLQQNPNVSPQQAVQNLLNSGRMSQQQFEQFRNIANKISGVKM
jgi:hypothetical protein